MLIDSQEVFSAAQTVTSTGDTVSTNILDTGAAHDQGIGEEMYLLAKVNVAVTSGGAATVAAVLQTSADNSTWTDALVGPAVPLASLTANAEILKTRLPVGLKRYVRVAYRVGTAALTAGSFDAFLVHGVQAQAYYASGFKVS